MSEEDRPVLDLESEVSPQGNPTPPGPIAVSDTTRRPSRRRRSAEAPALPPPKADRPLLFSGSALYLFGAALAAITWLAQLNPRAPVVGEQPYWPWQLFRSRLDAGGEPYIEWSYAYAVALVLALVVLFYVIAAILRSSHGRGATALLVTLLPVVLFWPDAGTPATYPAGLVAGIVGGAILLRHDHRRLGRGVLFVSTILLAGILFLPIPGAEAGTYRARALDLVQPFQDFLAGRMTFAENRLISADGLHTLLLLVLAALGLLAAFGLRRRWVKVAAGTTLLLVILLAPLAAGFFGLDNTRPLPGMDESQAPVDLLAVVSQAYWLGTLYLAVVLFAAVFSWLGLGGRWATWLAGTALLLLAFDTTGTLLRETMGAPNTPDPFGSGLVGIGEHLGRGAYAAFILPIAALVMDLATPRV